MTTALQCPACPHRITVSREDPDATLNTPTDRLGPHPEES